MAAGCEGPDMTGPSEDLIPADGRHCRSVLEDETIMRDAILADLRWLAALLVVAARAGCPAHAKEPAAATVRITTPMPPPGWALLERELLRAQERACLEFFDRYFDDRGFLECVERWGGDDGPD